MLGVARDSDLRLQGYVDVFQGDPGGEDVAYFFRTLECPVRFGSRDYQYELITAKMPQDLASIDVDPKMSGRQSNQIVAGTVPQRRRDRTHPRQSNRKHKNLAAVLICVWQQRFEHLENVALVWKVGERVMQGTMGDAALTIGYRRSHCVESGGKLAHFIVGADRDCAAILSRHHVFRRFRQRV